MRSARGAERLPARSLGGLAGTGEEVEAHERTAIPTSA
jgi:hypothetical protein